MKELVLKSDWRESKRKKIQWQRMFSLKSYTFHVLQVFLISFVDLWAHNAQNYFCQWLEFRLQEKEQISTLISLPLLLLTQGGSVLGSKLKNLVVLRQHWIMEPQWHCCWFSEISLPLSQQKNSTFSLQFKNRAI